MTVDILTFLLDKLWTLGKQEHYPLVANAILRVLQRLDPFFYKLYYGQIRTPKTNTANFLPSNRTYTPMQMLAFLMSFIYLCSC